MQRSRDAGWMFAALAAADIGIKLSYLPLLSILAPAKAELLDPARAPMLLSLCTLAGAGVASVVNLAMGALGDRLAARAPRRAWVALGAAAIVASCVWLGSVRTPGSLVAAVLALQVAVNLTISPLTVLIAQRFFHRPRPFVVGAGGASQPLASFLGAGLIAGLAPFGTLAYTAIGLVSVGLIAPFVLLTTEDRPGTAPREAPSPAPFPVSDKPAPTRDLAGFADLARLWTWRFALSLAGALSLPYALFRLRETQGAATPVLASVLDVSRLTLIGSGAHLVAAAALALAVGRGLGRRAAAAGAALLLGAAMIAFVVARGPEGFVLAFLLLGLGSGTVQAADAQLTLALLPSRASLGRDLGVLNLAYTGPQMLGPLAALATPGVAAGRVGTLFGLAALCCLAAAALAARMRPDSLRAAAA